MLRCLRINVVQLTMLAYRHLCIVNQQQNNRALLGKDTAFTVAIMPKREISTGTDEIRPYGNGHGERDQVPFLSNRAGLSYDLQLLSDAPLKIYLPGLRPDAADPGDPFWSIVALSKKLKTKVKQQLKNKKNTNTNNPFVAPPPPASPRLGR